MASFVCRDQGSRKGSGACLPRFGDFRDGVSATASGLKTQLHLNILTGRQL